MSVRKSLFANNNSEAGFTLIEILIVLVIITALSSFVIINFRASSTNVGNRHQVSSIIVAGIRQAQSLALSGTNFQGNIVCGYGLHYNDNASFIIYAKNKQPGQPCSLIGSRNYVAGSDSEYSRTLISNPNLAFASSFSDVFFEPPDPKTYINNTTLPNIVSIAINIVTKGQTCNSSNCTTVSIFSYGKIDITN